MQPPNKINVLDKHQGFTAVTTKRGDTLWRPGNILKSGTEGTLQSFDENSFFQDFNNATKAIYKVPGYRCPVACWFNNITGQRIA
jgi:hypothetical protein